jgi:hypothetical protein
MLYQRLVIQNRKGGEIMAAKKKMSAKQMKHFGAKKGKKGKGKVDSATINTSKPY